MASSSSLIVYATAIGYIQSCQKMAIISFREHQELRGADSVLQFMCCVTDWRNCKTFYEL